MRLNLSNTPAGHIARLDASLARSGSSVKLRRYVAGADTAIDLALPALVRGFAADQIVGAVKATDSSFVLSPTELTADPSWPGAAGAPRQPRIGDFLIVNDMERKIEAVQPVVLGGAVVRYDGLISGRG